MVKKCKVIGEDAECRDVKFTKEECYAYEGHNYIMKSK
jgi:hypothetical protein